jgi:two-component system sporulation sensor kinase C
MDLQYLSDLEKSLQSSADLRDEAGPAFALKNGIGILMHDATNRRLVESASLQLDLDVVHIEPALLQGDDTDAVHLNDLEVIVADQPYADQLRALFERRDASIEGVRPAIVAVPSPDPAVSVPLQSLDDLYDGVLPLPQLPAPLAAQLSLILYAHRAFSRRYQSALEELHLNRRIFRSVTSGISVANAQLPDVPLTYVNPAFEAMTGYKLEEVVGKNCRFLQGDHHNQPSVSQIRQAIAEGREITVVLKNFRKDGSAFWNELSLSPIRNRGGQVTHFVGIQTDVTARVEFETALRESEKLAAVGRLASTIAHEINNPLESVMNLVYLAERADSPAQTRQYLATADRELQRVKLITTQSLRFFKQSTRAQPLLCKELLDSVLDLYHSRLMNTRVTVTRRERSTRSVVCMESEIRQVFNNLISNAIDAMPEKGGRLLIRTRDATEPRSGVPGIMLTVADTGVGIGPDTMRNIYQAFYTTKGIRGTGLGLWISSEIVRRHHGRLMVRSCTGQGRSGTVFALFLPLDGLNA